MSWRKRRQFTILAILVLLLGSFGWYAYEQNRSYPTCFDTKQNQNEEDVDCGGSCIPCQFLKLQNVQVAWTRVIEVRKDSFDALASIKNPNIYYGSLRMDYAFELLDENGASIATRQGHTFLLPNEKITLIEPDIRTSLKPKTSLFKLRSIEWGRVYEPAPRYDIGLGKRDYEVITNPQGVKQGTVKTSVFNATMETFSEVFASVFLFDADRNIIAANKTLIENLAPGETRPVTFYWPEEIRGIITGIEGEVRVNSFIK